MSVLLGTFVVMPLGELLTEVLSLQQARTSAASDPAMKRRGVLVQQDLPAELRVLLHGAFPSWEVEGSNGKGSAAETPWTRLFDRGLSPRAGSGWYVVYLFNGAGDKVYLSLNQGTTIWHTGRRKFVYRPKEHLVDRVAWARNVLSSSNTAPKAFSDIALSGKPLGAAYNQGNVHGIEYNVHELPSDDELREDLFHIGRLLELLYTAQANTVYLPGDAPPEVADVELAAEEGAGNLRKARGRGQGFRLDTPSKLAIEQHAVKLATEHFKSSGYRVIYTGNKESYDLLAVLDGFEDDPMYIEVKGTASPGEQVILTRAEVEHHRAHPNNALVVVHSILIDRTGANPVAYGGTLAITKPWKIDDADLSVISYMYKTAVG